VVTTVAHPRVEHLLIALCAALAAVAICGGSAYAGEWVQVSCVNPNQTGAGSQGWISMIAGGGYGSNTNSNCGPGTPAYALLSTAGSVFVGSAETLKYIPPAGSTLNGGEIDVSMAADGHGLNASGVAVALTPEYVYDASNVFFECGFGLPACAPLGSNDFIGMLELPAGRGGDLYLSAQCEGSALASCSEGGSSGAWSLVNLWWANLRLSNDSTPGGQNFAGTLLQPNAHAVSELTFTALDPEGPGVYRVEVQVDGTTLYNGIPDSNGGACTPVGESGTNLMFDSSQPCKRNVAVDVPVETTMLPDGTHTLKVTVTDAAGNSSVVYVTTITTKHGPASAASAVVLGAPNGNPTSSEGARLLIKGPAHITRSFRQRAVTIAGSLEESKGAPISGASLDILEETPAGAVLRTLGQARTSSNGTFTTRVPAGPTRRITIAYRAYAGANAYSAQASVQETVTAGVVLRVTPGRTSSTGTITFSGQVQGSLPRHGVIVELLMYHRGRWEPFRDPRTDGHGRFHVSYQFEGALGRTPFRAEVFGEQSTFPYATGLSPIVYVHTS